MNGQCQRCKDAAHNAFLCPQCIEELHQELSNLGWWLDRTTETASFGQTRMSDNAYRKSAPRKDLDGDAELASCIEQLPSDDDLDKARRKRQQFRPAHALATGGINARASELLAEIADSLSFWCRVLCEQRGIDYHPRPSGRALGSTMPNGWPPTSTRSRTCGDAADITADILGRDRKRRGMIEQIQRVVNPAPGAGGNSATAPPQSASKAHHAKDIRAHHPCGAPHCGPEDAYPHPLPGLPRAAQRPPSCCGRASPRPKPSR